MKDVFTINNAIKGENVESQVRQKAQSFKMSASENVAAENFCLGT